MCINKNKGFILLYRISNFITKLFFNLKENVLSLKKRC